jgi:hypothetical protein
MAWIGDALELVVTRPHGPEDPLGWHAAPEIVQVGPNRPVERAVHPAKFRDAARPPPRGSPSVLAWLLDACRRMSPSSHVTPP